VFIVYALIAALCYGEASVLKHRSAQDVVTRPGASASLTSLLRQSLTHRAWLLAGVTDVVGVGFQLLALHSGALAVVQPLLSVELVVALALSRFRFRRGELYWVAALSITLAVIAALGPSDPRAAQAVLGSPRTAVTAATVVVALIACVLVGRRSTSRPSTDRTTAVVCGLGCGLAYAVCAGLVVSIFATIARQGWPAVIASWQPYALAAALLVSVVLSQLGFRAGPLHLSLPATAAADPVASIVIGVVVFRQPIAHGAAGLALLAVAATVLAAAVTRLGRAASIAQEPVRTIST
jgi:drug/metabolite transporter (DMT)-like permease